jgi:hypothetical protein
MEECLKKIDEKMAKLRVEKRYEETRTIDIPIEYV